MSFIFDEIKKYKIKKRLEDCDTLLRSMVITTRLDSPETKKRNQITFNIYIRCITNAHLRDRYKI